MSGWSKDRWIIPGFLTAAYLFIFLVIGFEYERHDGFYSLVMQGGFWTDRPESDIFIYYTYLSQIYSGLAKLIPGLDWFAVFMIFYSWAGVWMILDALYVSMRNINVDRKVIFILLSIIFTLLIFENVFQIQSLRTPFLLSIGIAMQLFVAFGQEGKLKLKKNIFLIISCLLLLAIAFWTKYEASMLIFAMTAGLALIYFAPVRSALNICIKFFIPGSIFVFLLWFNMINRNDSTQYGWTFLRNAYTYEDAVYIIKPDLETKKDSILQEVFEAGFRCDKKQIDEAFFNERTVKPAGIMEFFITRNVLKEYGELFYQAITNSHHLSKILFNLIIFLTCLGWHFFVKKVPKQWFVRYLLFNFFFWFGFVTLEFLITRPVHIESPVYLWYSAFHILFAIPFFKEGVQNWDKSQKIAIVLGLVLLISVGYETYKTNQIKSEYERYREKVLPVRAELDKLFDNHILVPMVSASQLFIRQPFKGLEMDESNRVFVYDGLSSLFGFMDGYLKRTMGSSEFDDFYKFLSERKDNVVFLSPPARMEMFSRYLSIVYGDEYEFKTLFEPGSTEISKAGLEYMVFKTYGGQ